MVSKFFRSKPPYTQEQIKEQQQIIDRSMALRASVDKDNKEEYNRASTSVEVAQEILNFMLEAIEASNKPR